MTQACGVTLSTSAALPGPPHPRPLCTPQGQCNNATHTKLSSGHESLARGLTHTLPAPLISVAGHSTNDVTMLQPLCGRETIGCPHQKKLKSPTSSPQLSMTIILLLLLPPKKLLLYERHSVCVEPPEACLPEDKTPVPAPSRLVALPLPNNCPVLEVDAKASERTGTVRCLLEYCHR